MAEESESLYSVKEAASAAGLSDQIHVVYRLVRSGELKGIKMGGTIRLPASEVERLKRAVEEERGGVSVEDVAADFGVERSTARSWLRQGKIPARPRLLGRGQGLYSPREHYDRWRREIASG